MHKIYIFSCLTLQTDISDKNDNETNVYREREKQFQDCFKPKDPTFSIMKTLAKVHKRLRSDKDLYAGIER